VEIIKTMALTNEELELQSAEYLPAREVMTGLGGGHGHCGVFGGLVAVDLDIQEVDVVKDIYILNGDNDVVDIL
jgi:hypothetical protein